MTPAILKSQRDGFLRYIRGFEDGGPAILVNLMNQGRCANHENGWRAVSETLDIYLKVAKSIIDECAEINERDYFVHTNFRKRTAHEALHFTHGDRLSTSVAMVSKPSTPLSTTVVAPALTPRSTSRLETLARELTKLRSRNRVKPEASNGGGGSSQQQTPSRTSSSLGSLYGLGSHRSMKPHSTDSSTNGGN